MMTSFARHNDDMMSSLAGTRVSTRGMQLLTSTGVSSLDSFTGGGLPIQSVTLLEDDLHARYSTMITKCFISEGMVHKHQIIISSPTTTSINSRLLKELPTFTQVNSNELMSNDMKIAWRYKSLAAASSEASEQFDFGVYVDEETLNQANINFVNHDALIKFNFDYDPNKCLTRIVVQDLGSPLSPISIESIPMFIYNLKSFVRRNPNVVCLVTFSSQMIQSSNFAFVCSRIYNNVDCAIKLIPFDESTQTPYKEYDGLVNILKLPKLNSLNYYFVPETFDLGFKLKKHSRFLIVDKLCLPPDLSETVSRTTTCHTLNKNFDF